jgi:hypothetical protein
LACRLDQQVFDIVPFGPGQAGELRTIVGAYGERVATKAGSLIQQTRHVGAADAVIDRQIDALVVKSSAIVRHFRQRPLDNASLRTPCFQIALGALADCKRCRSIIGVCLPALAHGQVGLAIQPLDAFVIHGNELQAQQVVQAAIAEGDDASAPIRPAAPATPDYASMALVDGGRHRGPAPHRACVAEWSAPRIS